MATTFSDVICNHFMDNIDDLRMTREMAENPAQALRRLSIRLQNAIPRFTRPPEMQKWLTYTPPTYDDYLYTAETDQAAPATIPTKKVGYEMCSVALVGRDTAGNVTNTPIACSYDAETGDVTLQSDIAKGQVLDIDFYTDGVFTNELSNEQKHILGLCMAYNWFNRFSNTWLNMTPKIKDKTFDVGSESAQMTANTAKLRETRVTLNDALLRYEQSLSYLQNMPANKQLKPTT